MIVGLVRPRPWRESAQPLLRRVEPRARSRSSHRWSPHPGTNRGYTRHAAIRPNKPTPSPRTRRAEPPSLGLEFPFQYCPWQFPNKVDCQSAFFNALQVENSASAHFEKSRGSKSKRLACDKAHPSLPILVFSRGDAAIASGPLVLIGSYRSVPCVAPSIACRDVHHCAPLRITTTLV
jgi:hypothetical protein